MKVSFGTRLLPDKGESRNDPVPVYDIGQRIQIFADFVDDAGDAADPTTVVLQIIDPEGGLSSLAMANPAVGSYTYDLDVPKSALSAGTWLLRVEGSGAVVAAEERRFEVESSAFYASDPLPVASLGSPVYGPLSSTDLGVPRWDGAGGNKLQDTPWLVADDAALRIENLTIVGVEGSTNRLRLASADADRPDVTFATVSVPNSDAGEPNQVMTIGHNREGGGGRQDGSRHSWHMALEREFYTGTNRQAEFYIQYVAADASVTLRPFAADVNTSTHKCIAGIRGAQNWANSDGVSNANYTESGQFSLFGSSASLRIDPGNTGENPFAGTLQMIGTGQTVVRVPLTAGGYANVTAFSVSGTPNLVLGSVANPGGLFLDTGGSITMRVNGGTHAVFVQSTVTTFGMPIRLPGYTVASLPGANPRTLAYVTDGDAGAPCLAVHDGSTWRRIALGSTVSAT